MPTRVVPGAHLAGAQLLVGSRGEPSNKFHSAQLAHGLTIEPQRGGPEWDPANLVCGKYTKKGTPCRSRPVTGTSLCIGHTRQEAVEVARAAKGS